MGALNQAGAKGVERKRGVGGGSGVTVRAAEADKRVGWGVEQGGIAG